MLREMLLDCGLSEELKWGCPCYTFQGNNIVLIHYFKEYCALLFFKGALLSDAEGILVQQTENVQATRQIRFSTVQEIKKAEATVRAYIYEALEIEKAGLKVALKTVADYFVPEELLAKFEEVPAFKTAFYALTPGRQKGYLLHFAQPKQAKTRVARIEKCLPLIFEGKGHTDL